MVAGPGFINITLSDAILLAQATAEVPQSMAGTNYVVEYSCPNAFKELHAGHLYQTIAGDVIARLLEQSGATVHRTNFGGDVGLHVAKAMWGIIEALEGENPEKLFEITTDQQANFLSSSYVKGAAAYEDNAEARRNIEQYNQLIYSIHSQNEHDSLFAQIYWTCRQWSYDYFDRFYERLQVDPFHYYPESTTAAPGLKLVHEGLERGVFENSDGAVVYRGEKVGLHTRVFVTQAGLPTYETKDLGVISLEYQEYNFDHRILITGRDQAEYMRVVYAAAGEMIPAVNGVMTHITNGIIKFGDGTKMSSRLGNVTSATDVLNTVYEHVPEKNDELVKNGLALGAVKYAFLKQRLGGDVAFDPETSVSLQGNSGPYLQYALVRARSILEKAGDSSTNDSTVLESGERALVQKMTGFQDAVAQATTEYAPHVLCTYLYELAGAFNVFYEHNRVLDGERSAVRLMLVERYAEILDKGLELLGIERLSKM
jgi:arginyl-tRNA synthetase